MTFCPRRLVRQVRIMLHLATANSGPFHVLFGLGVPGPPAQAKGTRPKRCGNSRPLPHISCMAGEPACIWIHLSPNSTERYVSALLYLHVCMQLHAVATAVWYRAAP